MTASRWAPPQRSTDPANGLVCETRSITILAPDLSLAPPSGFRFIVCPLGEVWYQTGDGQWRADAFRCVTIPARWAAITPPPGAGPCPP